MAIYHCSIKIISRGKGKSAVAASAYRAGETITNEYDGIANNYTGKRGIVHTEILLPEHAPLEYTDRTTLWNAVEKIEKSSRAQLSREIELALPIELSRGRNIELVRQYVQKHFVSAGMCADVCIHDKNDGNPHAHIMLTMRPLEQDGSWGAKSKKEYIFDNNGEKIRLKSGEFKSKKISTTDWNEQTKAEEWRAGWADMCNAFLESENVNTRIDHRSYERQGIEQIPTVHIGVAATQMERRGIATEMGNRNREIGITNQQIRQLQARINRLKDQLAEQSKNVEVPTLVDAVKNQIDGTIKGLQSAAKTVNFLSENKIYNTDDLQEKVETMSAQNQDIRKELKPIERRLKTLKEHIRNAEDYLKYKDIHREYRQQDPKKRNKFYERYRSEIELFETVEKYLKKVLNGNKLPLKAWKAEYAKLTAEKMELYKRYTPIQDQVHNIEIIQRNSKSPTEEKTKQMPVYDMNDR